jgi:Small-conductance mechanosensitive channel
MLRHVRHWLAAMLLILIADPAFAQLLPAGEEPSQAASEAAPVDPYGRETPRGVVSGLVDSLADKDYARAGNYFQGTRNGERKAQMLQTVLDRGGSLQTFSGLSNAAEGALNDGLDPDTERVGTLGDKDATPILLSRGTGPNGTTIWRISSETMRAVAALDPEPESPEEQGLEFAGASVTDWLILLGIAGVVYLAFQLVAAAVLAVMGRIIADRDQSPAYRFAQAAVPPLSLFLSTIAFRIWADNLPVSIVARQILLKYIGIFALVALAWFLARLIDAIARIAIVRMEERGQRQVVSVIALLRRAAKVLLLFGAVVAILDTFGIDVTTGIAALGIGGIALALGAQKTVENLVGSVSLIADKPMQIGDFCKLGDVTGTIEDIGIRSTRVRTLARTVVTIPNGDLSAQKIENYSKRDQFLFNPTIGVEYGIGSAKLLEAVELIEAVLNEHDRVIKPGCRARFTLFGDSALNIEIFSYLQAADFDESLVIQQDLLLMIFMKLEKAEIGIAFPTRTVRLISGSVEEAKEQLGAAVSGD